MLPNLMKWDQILSQISWKKEEIKGIDGKFNEIKALDIQIG